MWRIPFKEGGTSMNRVKCAGVLASAMVLITAGSAPAQQPQPCAMMKDHQMGGMQQQGMPGMGMMQQDKDKQMGRMQGCMMMEDMKKQQQLMLEMMKHMRMMDEMMEMMMQQI